ncbi:flagellum-associated coiled-coil domain-containing protein 1 isoform X4 [Equus asinus]|uniref:flagellum-associated coiled-coil domain-containing protein 1 isoform X4 n=1 Tax=Equus asinus TaxID=9793 RepID=UPI0038F6CDC1
MDPNPLIYCTCWDPWNSGPRKLIKTPQPLSKSSTGKPKVKTHFGKQEESNKSPCEVINVSPGYRLTRNREQISVTLGDEMFDRKKQLESEIMDKVKISRTDIIVDLEEQISELTVIIEQMNRDHQSTQKSLSHEMDLRCAKMQQSFENKTRKLKEAHTAELAELENNYKAALRAEKLAAQEKLEEMQKEYKYLKNMFYMYQDSIYDELEDKWSKKKAEWEKDEKLEREKILLKQKHNITKKFELESEEEKKKIQDSHSAVFENFNREKEVIEEELHTQALILESLNATLYQTQMELQKEKAVVGNLEKKLQAKLAEAEEKFKYTIQLLTEENIHLRQKIIAKNEEIYQRYGRSPSLTVYEEDSDTVEDGSKKRQES